MKRLLVLLLCSCLCAPVFADVLSQLKEQLQLSEQMTGRFRQEKKLTFLKKPFVSTGTYNIDAKTGLLWEVEAPLKSEMRVTDGKVFIDGQPVSDHGVGHLMAQIMLGFMSGDLSVIERYFQVTGDASVSPWSIVLVPRKAQLRKALKHLQLQGSTTLETLRIVENEGHQTTILLTLFSGSDTPEQTTEIR